MSLTHWLCSKVRVACCNGHLQRCGGRRPRALVGICWLLLVSVFPMTAAAIDDRGAPAAERWCATADDCQDVAMRPANNLRRFALTRTLSRRGNARLILEPVAIKLKFIFLKITPPDRAR